MKTLIIFFIAINLFPVFVWSQHTEGYLLATLGKDTVGAEHYVMKGNVLESESIRLINSITVVKNKTIFNENGAISSDEQLFYNPEDSLIGRYYQSFYGDSIFIEQGLGDKKSRKTNAWNLGKNPHFLLAQFFIFGNCGKLVHSYERFPQASYFASGSPLSITKIKEGKYKLYSRYPETFFIETNNDDQVLKVHSEGAGGGLSIIANKISGEEYQKLTHQWLNDPTIKPVSIVSPRVKEAFTLQNTKIELNYSSPSKRGRDIFGGLVPYKKRWRTGSNLATHITFDQDLIFEDQVVPKGTYTMFTIPTPNEWTFILNKQNGQWGTIYDESQDALRLTVDAVKVNAVVESFKINVEETEKGGRLVLAWDQTKVAIPFEESR